MFLWFQLAKWIPLRHSTYNDPKIFVFGGFHRFSKKLMALVLAAFDHYKMRKPKRPHVNGTVVRETWKLFGVDFLFSSLPGDMIKFH